MVQQLLQKESIQSTSQSLEKFCLSLHYHGTVIYLLIVQKFHKFKAKDSEIVATPLCPENISKDISADIMKKTGLYGYVYDFSIMILLQLVMH